MTPDEYVTHAQVADAMGQAITRQQYVDLMALCNLPVADQIAAPASAEQSACQDEGISVCPKMAYSNKQLGRQLDEARAQLERQHETIETLQAAQERVRTLAERWSASPYAALQQSGHDILKSLDEPTPA